MNSDRQLQPPPRGLIRNANLLLLALAAFCAAAFLAACLLGRVGAYRIVPLSLAIILVASLFLPASAKIAFALSCCSVVLALYAAEFYFTFGLSPNSIGRFAKQAGSFDTRSAFDVVSNLRSQGMDAHANWAGRLPLAAGKESLSSAAGAILPLGGLSKSLIVFCNETGRYVTYQSDEHGFNNPAGIWTGAPVRIAALGDSFAQGFCTPQDQTFVARIRQRFPQTLTLGMVGNGPLFELAALKEYVTALRPPTVLWFYFEANDLQDLEDESRSTILMSYLHKADFSQGLIGKQPEIDGAWQRYESDQLSAWKSSRPPRLLQPIGDWVQDISVEHKNRSTAARVFRLREVRGRVAARFGQAGDEVPEIPLLHDVLAQADGVVKSWGGTLHFVFLPGMELLMNPQGRRGRLASLAVQQARDLGIPVIDIREAFRPQPIAPLFYYPDSHYSEKGAALVAQAVLTSLDRGSVLQNASFRGTAGVPSH